MAVCSYEPEGVGEAVSRGGQKSHSGEVWVCGMRRTVEVEDEGVVGREGDEVEVVCGVGLSTQLLLLLLSLLFFSQP